MAQFISLSGRYEVRNRTEENPVRTLNSIEGKRYTMVGNCGTNDGSSYRGTDHGPNLDAVENAGMAFEGTDVGLRGIADDGIHCDGGPGANCYASCHETHGANAHVAPSHWKHQMKPHMQQPLWLEKHCETYH